MAEPVAMAMAIPKVEALAEASAIASASAWALVKLTATEKALAKAAAWAPARGLVKVAASGFRLAAATRAVQQAKEPATAW